jgi:hypothetical protein
LHDPVSFQEDASVPFDLPTFTLIHVLLSLVGIFTGLVVVGGLMAGVRLDGWIGLFLAATVLTNVTAFGFPFHALLPSHIVAGISLLVLPVAIAARYWKHLSGPWRQVFVLATLSALYLNIFVLLAQLFVKIPALIIIAPTQKAPAFVATQLLVLALFARLGTAAVRGFRAERAVR